MPEQLDNPLDGRGREPPRQPQPTHAYLSIYDGKCEGVTLDMGDLDTAAFVSEAICAGSSIERVTLDLARAAIGKPWPPQAEALGKTPSADGITIQTEREYREAAAPAPQPPTLHDLFAPLRAQVSLINAAPAMLAALRGASSIRPDNWDEGSDPEQEAAWRAVDAAIATAAGSAP